MCIIHVTKQFNYLTIINNKAKVNNKNNNFNNDLIESINNSDFSSSEEDEEEISEESEEDLQDPSLSENEEINDTTLNGLENFQIDDESTPELFNSDSNENTFSSEETNINNNEEDDLELPAFLRRQKN